MNSLDYTTIKVVGVVEPHTNGIHAYLRVIGYIDPDTGWKFKRLYPDEIKEKFPTRGLIFMPNFLKKYRNLCGQCIYTGIQVSNKGMINLYGIEMLVFRQNMESLFAKKNFARRTQKVSMKLYQAIRILPIFTTGHFYIDIHPKLGSHTITSNNGI